VKGEKRGKRWRTSPPRLSTEREAGATIASFEQPKARILSGGAAAKRERKEGKKGSSFLVSFPLREGERKSRRRSRRLTLISLKKKRKSRVRRQKIRGGKSKHDYGT